MRFTIVAASVAAFAMSGSAQAHMLQPAKPVKDLSAKQQLRYAHATVAHARAVIATSKQRLRNDRRLLATHPRYAGWVEFDLTVRQVLALEDLRFARVRLYNHRWLLRYGLQLEQAAAAQMNPWAVPGYFMSEAICVHHGEGSWNDDTGNGFGGGLQFMVGTWNHAASLSHGKLAHVKYTSQIAAMPPAAQIYAAYLIVVVEGSGWGQWPNTARACGLL